MPGHFISSKWGLSGVAVVLRVIHKSANICRSTYLRKELPKAPFRRHKKRYVPEFVPQFIPEFIPEFVPEFDMNTDFYSGTNFGMNSGTNFFLMSSKWHLSKDKIRWKHLVQNLVKAIC